MIHGSSCTSLWGYMSNCKAYKFRVKTRATRVLKLEFRCDFRFWLVFLAYLIRKVLSIFKLPSSVACLANKKGALTSCFIATRMVDQEVTKRKRIWTMRSHYHSQKI